MSDCLWTDAEALADRIRESPEVAAFLQAFDPEQGPLAQKLAEFSGRYSFLRTSPLLVAVRALDLPGVDEYFADEEECEWFELARKIGVSFQILIELVRSRLPAYPVLRVPHCRRGSPYLLGTDGAFVHDFPWDRALKQPSLQLCEPAEFDSLFGSQPGIAAPLAALLADLQERPSWQRFSAAHQALDSSDREQLGDLGKTFAKAVSLEEVRRHSGDGLLAHYQYRLAVLEETLATSSGAAAEYLNAFEEVDQLITIVASYMQKLIVDRGLLAVVPERMDLGFGAEVIPVDLYCDTVEDFFEPGEAILVETSSELRGIAYPETINFSLNADVAARIAGQFVRLAQGAPHGA